MPHENELAIPPDAEESKDAVEIGRVWVCNGALNVSLRVGVFDGIGTWGVLLADLARHIADAQEQLDHSDPENTLDEIKEALDAEWGLAVDEEGEPGDDADSDDDEAFGPSDDDQ